MREMIKGTTLIISHQERILNIADEIVLLKNGKIDKDENSKKMLENTIEANRGCCRVRKEGAKI